jgi:hypothetical protein
VIALYSFQHPSVQWLYSPNRALASSFLRFLNHTELDTRQDSSGRVIRGLYLHRTTQHINTRDKHHARAGFEPAIPVTRRPQPYAFVRAATGIGNPFSKLGYKISTIPPTFFTASHIYLTSSTLHDGAIKSVSKLTWNLL